MDVHCLAGLIKAWFRELPSGVLDGLSPEQVLECNTEEECVELIKQLKPTENALLSWAVDLMADVVEHEESNKMNARNIAMVFAPNMTQVLIQISSSQLYGGINLCRIHRIHLGLGRINGVNISM